MRTLRLDLRHVPPEPCDEPSPAGFVRVQRGMHRAVLLTPEEVDPARPHPLVTALHGAGRQDELLAKLLRDEPDRRRALFLIPRSLHPTWDLIAGPSRGDLDFLEYAYDLIYRRYPIDPGRQSLLGFSDGASYALSVGLSNPRIFSAVAGWAAGFRVIDEAIVRTDDPRPRVLLEYGRHDELFPFDEVAVPMRDELAHLGYPVELRVDETGGHWPREGFLGDALDWLLG